ncbi:hypothetical protein BDR05DRAFT_1001009 [Suillus weaverae]|nr:hypothetical protein BDR05DRAFT_1001009 [Suillus weaverae]
MSITSLLAHNDASELTDDEATSGHDHGIKSVGNPDNEDQEMAEEHILTELVPQSGLPEMLMIAEMKGLAVPGNEKDEKEGEPIFPRVLALLFQERLDIKAALRPNFGHVHPKSSSCQGKIKNNLGSQNVPSSSKSKVGFNGTVLQTPDPNVLHDISHSYTALEEDQYFNDLGDSPAEMCHPPGTKHTWSAPNSFIGFLHNTAQLSPDAVSVMREDTEESFFAPHSLSPSESVHTIDPSLLSISEPPLKLPLSSIPAGPIIYVCRPPGVSTSQEAPAFSGKIKYCTGESASLTADEGNVTISTGKLELTKNNGGRTAEAVSTPPAQHGAQSKLKIQIHRPEPPESVPQTMSGAHVYDLEGKCISRAFIDDARTSTPV